MVSTNDIVAQILSLDEDDFFRADQSVFGPREGQLLDLNYFGVAVNAPPRIETDDRESLPLIMAIRFSGDRDWDIPLKNNCVMVGTNLQDGTVRFAKAFVSKKEMQNRGIMEKVSKGPKPPGLATAAAQLTELDPKDRLHIKWDTGTWALGVICYDWPSNIVVVELKGDEVVKPLSAKPVKPDPDPRGGANLPCYLPTSQSPKLPESGLAIDGGFHVENGTQHLNLFASFTLVTRDFHLPDQPLVHRFEKSSQQNVAAVVPVTFAVLGMDWDEPLQFDWAVPVYGDPLEVGKLAQGYFAIDALAEAQPLSPGKYLCYLLMDGRIFGPYDFQISELTGEDL